MIIQREDMLELTRRMTPARNCFDRIAGAYLDEEGFVDGTFNIHFGKLDPSEQLSRLQLAKSVPFSRTNDQLRAFSVPGKRDAQKQLIRLLCGLRQCGLKNDALLDTFYELVGDAIREKDFRVPDIPHGLGWGVNLVHGSYDVPLKASDQARLWESEEVYDFLIGSLSPQTGDYEVGEAIWGFVFPAFVQRSTDLSAILLYDITGAHTGALHRLFL